MPTFTVTADELKSALARFDAEAVPGSVRTPRYRLRYATWGDGPHTLVLVHGMCDLPRSFAMLMAHLAGGIRCVVYHLADGRGDGATLGPYRHSDFAHDLVALLDHLGVERADVLGSSFGSTIALRTAWLYPDRLRRVVLQGGFPRRPLIRAERGLARVGRFWPWRMGELPIRDRVMRRLEAPAFASAPPEVFEFLIANSGRTPARAAANRALTIDRLDLRPLLPDVRHPVLLVGGDRDAIVPRRYEAELEAGLPDVRRVEFAPCGHYPQYTHPGPMADAVRAFLLGPANSP
jgi:pimeloyl-ACP methyl ester carboxylesterase